MRKENVIMKLSDTVIIEIIHGIKDKLMEIIDKKL